MHEILEEYKKRLIDGSENNKRFIELKLSSGGMFDLSNLCDFNNKGEEIVEYIISREESKLKILEKNTENIEAFRCSESLLGIMQEINYIYKETGRFELFIGYPFVEGTLNNNMTIKAPLVLFPVSLIEEGENWYIKNNIEGNVFVNKILLLAIEKYNNVNIDAIKTIYEDTTNSFVENIINELQQKGIKINFKNRSLEPFSEYIKGESETVESGKLDIVHNLILGQFPIVNSIDSDYEEMISLKLTTPLLEDLLKTNVLKRTLTLEEEEHGKLAFSESELFLVSTLDYSQEQAVMMQNKTDRLLIYGPPGTGKSETIVNIIADALAKDKKVLVVSQKRSALDTIFNRLDLLNSKAMLLHDANKERKHFYESISKEINIIEKPKKNYKENITNLSKNIDEKIMYLEVIGKALYKKRKCGLTLHEMYSKCTEISSRKDQRYNEFIRFRKNNKFKNTKYVDILKESEDISKDQIHRYRIYLKLRENNSLLDSISLNLSIIEVDEYSQIIKDNINEFKKLTDKINSDSVIYSGLIDLYHGYKESLTTEIIEEFAKKLNKEQNGNLLDEINTGKWWSIRRWKQHSENIKKEDENFDVFLDKQTKTINEVKEIYIVLKKQLELIKEIKNIIDDNTYNNIVNDISEGKDILDYFYKILDGLKLLDEYGDILKEVREFTSLKRKILEYANDDSLEISKERIKALPEFVLLHNILDAEKEEEVQKALGYIEEYDDIINEVINDMNIKQENVKDLILNNWNCKILHLADYNRSYKELKREACKRRGFWPIRNYMDQFYDAVFEMFPCFLMSPETVSEVLPLKEGLFDLVIFDEASQMYIQNAIPAIYRSNQVIILGDDKQLTPYEVHGHEDINENEHEKVSSQIGEDSILDLAKINYNTVNLSYYYRSNYNELINFSNYAFYKRNLKISPSINARKEDNIPIERIKVCGRLIDKENIEEANAVVSTLKKVLKERKYNESVGIITFSISQKNCIKRVITRELNEDTEFKSMYLHELQRENGNEDNSIFIKSIEEIQGDERDIIIFSIGYALDENGEITRNFGSLSLDKGENNLNVAISRAKNKIYVVTSIESEDLDLEGIKDRGPNLLKKYLQYVKAVSERNKDEEEKILYSVLDKKDIRCLDEKYDDELVEQVYEELIKKGYTVHKKIDELGYYIDLAIIDKVTSKYILGIDCSGLLYNKYKSARERDINRQRYLESKVWKLYRVWGVQWYRNKDVVIKEIDDLVAQITKDNCRSE